MNKHTIEIYYNGAHEYCRAFPPDGDVEAAVRVCKKRVCRTFGVDPKSEEGERFMALLSASVDRPEAIAAVIEKEGGIG